jgi:L-lactate dehydrogenase complex protein LldF
MSATPPVSFERRVALALGDARLRSALDSATGRFLTLRAEGLASLPDPEGTRDRARAIRAETLAHLDEHLERFVGHVAAVGGHVHWASDASEAVRKVLAIARGCGAKLAVKSKSMISEEVHLNPALEAAGVRVIESDLGEFIIQLAGETPSHIVVPAVHKTKEQIGALFHEKLGVPLTHDPAEMARVAREKLREAYLRADMGISGVNFGVAETGSIAIVTNEGNASLATTAPRVHVAMMGIERIVPSLHELATLLRVLARSATGQKATVYYDLITGPRRAGEPDGPEELHVVLLDNGRSRVLAGPSAEILYCIRCGACLNACPVYREIGGHAYGSVYPGPVGAVLMPALEGIRTWSDLPQASSLCGACREVCPVRIDIPRMLLQQRHEAAEAGQAPLWARLGLRVYRIAALRPWLFRQALRLTRTVTRGLAREGWLRRLPPPLAAWTASRDFPALARRSFQEEWRSGRRE